MTVFLSLRALAAITWLSRITFITPPAHVPHGGRTTTCWRSWRPWQRGRGHPGAVKRPRVGRSLVRSAGWTCWSESASSPS